MTGRSQILVPFDAAEALSVAEAAAIAGRSDDTVRRWAQFHDLGRRIGGRWVLSRYALAMDLDGNRGALKALLAGERNATSVRPYLSGAESLRS